MEAAEKKVGKNFCSAQIRCSAEEVCVVSPNLFHRNSGECLNFFGTLAVTSHW